MKNKVHNIKLNLLLHYIMKLNLEQKTSQNRHIEQYVFGTEETYKM